jgi:hypothetical protein
LTDWTATGDATGVIAVKPVGTARVPRTCDFGGSARSLALEEFLFLERGEADCFSGA